MKLCKNESMISYIIQYIVNSFKSTYCNDLRGLILRAIAPSLENEGWEVKWLRFVATVLHSTNAGALSLPTPIRWRILGTCSILNKPQPSKVMMHPPRSALLLQLLVASHQRRTSFLLLQYLGLYPVHELAASALPAIVTLLGLLGLPVRQGLCQWRQACR